MNIPDMQLDVYYTVTESRTKQIDLLDLRDIVSRNSQFSALPEWTAECEYGEHHDTDLEYLDRLDSWFTENSSVIRYVEREHDVTSEDDLQYEEFDEA